LLADLPADAASVVSGRLHVSLTDLKLRNHLVSEFANREELADALACSCFIPAFSGYRVPRYRGRPFLDGGLTNSLPALEAAGPQPLIRVSPFSGPGKEICPPDIQAAAANALNNEDGAMSAAKKRPGVFTFAGENVYMTRANLQRGFHALGAVSEAQLASYYLAGFRDASRYFTMQHFYGTGT